MNYVTKVAAKSTDKKASEIGILINASSLTGARQVGKSTMLAQVLPDIKTFVFDPVQDIYGAWQDPDLFLDTYPSPLSGQNCSR